MSLSAYISVDIEGVTGFVHPDQDESDEAATAMAREVNAVIDGLRRVDQAASVTVADAHGRMRTMPIDDLRPNVSLVRGRNRPHGMVDGATPVHDLAVFLGYHDRPGSGGVLEHTFSGSLASVELDGHPVGETTLNAAMLTEIGVPLALVSGDSRLGQTIDDRFPDVEFVPTKETRGSRAAASRPPVDVEAALADAAETVATEIPDRRMPLGLEPPIDVRVRFHSPRHAELAAQWPGVARAADSRVITHQATDIDTMYQFVRAAAGVSPRD